MLSGPIVGSFLYEAGGFKLPFFVTGFLLFLLILPISCFLKNDKKTHFRTPSSSSNDDSPDANVPAPPKLTFFGVLKNF